MRVLLLAVGRPRDRALVAAIRAYEARITHHFRFQAVEVRDAAATVPDERAREEEAAALLHAIPEGFRLVALDPRGVAWSSEELAEFLGDLALHGHPGVAFALGGPRGLGESLLRRADRRWALSRLTLPHELARLVLVEQLYRAGTILRGVPYHR